MPPRKTRAPDKPQPPQHAPPTPQTRALAPPCVLTPVPAVRATTAVRAATALRATTPVRSILVRYHGAFGLGDLLCSDPMILGLAERFPGARIWLAGPAGNVVHNPLVAGMAPPDLRPDHVVDVRLFTHMDLEEYGRLEALPSLVDHMCSYATVRPSDRRPKLHLGPAEHAFVQQVGFARLPRPRVAICADHVDPLRHWPVERWRAVAAVLQRAGARVIEIGTRDRLGVGLDLIGRLSIRQTAAVLTQCDLFLGNNSGPFHYAQAAGCTCVVLFSLASPRRFVHDGARVFPVQATELPCIDCMTRRFAAMQRLGCIASPRGRCVTDVQVEQVLAAVEQALATVGTRERVATPPAFLVPPTVGTRGPVASLPPSPVPPALG